MVDKIVTSLVQMVVVLALYAPIVVGLRWWQARKTRRMFANIPSPPSDKCMCGKWVLPTTVNVETHGLTGEIPSAPTAVTFACPACGVPIRKALMPTMLTSRPKLAIVGLKRP